MRRRPAVAARGPTRRRRPARPHATPGGCGGAAGAERRTAPGPPSVAFRGGITLPSHAMPYEPIPGPQPVVTPDIGAVGPATVETEPTGRSGPGWGGSPQDEFPDLRTTGVSPQVMAAPYDGAEPGRSEAGCPGPGSIVVGAPAPNASPIPVVPTRSRENRPMAGPWMTIYVTTRGPGSEPVQGGDGDASGQVRWSSSVSQRTCASNGKFSGKVCATIQI